MKLTAVLMEPAPGGGDYSVQVDEAGHYYTFYRAPWEAEQAKVGDPAFHVGPDGRDSFAQAKWFIRRYVQGREEWRALKERRPPVKWVGPEPSKPEMKTLREPETKSNPDNPYLLVERAGYAGETILAEGWDQQELRDWALEHFSHEEIGRRKMAIARDGENETRWYMRSLTV